MPDATDTRLSGPGFDVPIGPLSQDEIDTCGLIMSTRMWTEATVPHWRVTIHRAPPRVLIHGELFRILAGRPRTRGKDLITGWVLRERDGSRARLGNPDNVLRLSDDDGHGVIYVLRRYDAARHLLLATWPD